MPLGGRATPSQLNVNLYTPRWTGYAFLVLGILVFPNFHMDLSISKFSYGS